MLYIVKDFGSEIHWHRGESLPSDLNIHQVVEVQADGEELEMILLRQENLPVPNRGRVMRWFGDHAKFIVANLLDD